jgi:hypothetical protein
MKATYVLVVLGATAGCVGTVKPEIDPPGDEKSAKTQVLEFGANALQTDIPPDALNIYLVGFHPIKANPANQLEAHHFCRQVNEDFAQCALFDANSRNANLNGIEYIISEKLFETLPDDEKKYWHPHNYEILSGQLVAPGIPAIAENELMKSKINSYGKTWHVWNTGHYGSQDGTKLPIGEPMLAWSFNHDGEALPGLINNMEQTLGVNVSAKRSIRRELVKLAKPQSGVDAIAREFAGPISSIPGVEDKQRPKITTD